MRRALDVAAIRLNPGGMEGVFLSGQLLIAMPGIGDPRFERSLILVCAHDPQHAMGIALNRPVEGLTIPDLLERLHDLLAQSDFVVMTAPRTPASNG